MKMPSWWPWVSRKRLEKSQATTDEIWVELSKMRGERDKAWEYASNPTKLDRQLADAALRLERSNRSLRGVVTKLRAERNELKAELAIANKRIGHQPSHEAMVREISPEDAKMAERRIAIIDGMLGMGKGTKK